MKSESEKKPKRKYRKSAAWTPEAAKQIAAHRAEQKAIKFAERQRALKPRFWPSGRTLDEVDAIIRAAVRIDPWNGRPLHHDLQGGFQYADNGTRAPFRSGYAAGLLPLDQERQQVSKQLAQPQTEMTQ